MDSAGIKRLAVAMKESYREGVTNHPGPEPCEGGRKTAVEALDRGICRLGIELRNRTNRGDHLPRRKREFGTEPRIGRDSLGFRARPADPPNRRTDRS